jgi:hypothetical protein
VDRLHLSVELSRRQLVAGHVATWMGYWPAVLVMAGIMAFVLTVAWRKSPWFLLTLLVLFPVWNNLILLVAGFVTPVLFGPVRVDIVVEDDRIGERRGQVWRWVPLETVDRVAAAAIDEAQIAHIRAAAERGRGKAGRPPPAGADGA